MSAYSDKLQEIKFQLLKNVSNTLTDEELIEAARSIYDASINTDMNLPTDIVLPTSVFGTSLIWASNHEATISKGDYSVDDDFYDDIIPPISSLIPNNAFKTNGGYFKTNSKYFTIR